jgi:hypothetical protein
MELGYDDLQFKLVDANFFCVACGIDQFVGPACAIDLSSPPKAVQNCEMLRPLCDILYNLVGLQSVPGLLRWSDKDSLADWVFAQVY